MNNTENYDAIIIGSGMGALTTAVLLAKEKKQRVLLIEKHFKGGGFTHSFTRQKFTWDVGLHYIGDLHPKSSVRKMYDYITNGQLQWNPITDPFQYYVFPKHKIAVRSSLKEYADELKKHFADEADKIDRYFKKIRQVQKWSSAYFVIQKLPTPLAAMAKFLLANKYKYFTMSTKEFFDQLQISKELAAVLDAQCGDYGLPMHESSLLAHVAVNTHYLRGAYYPVGGSGQIYKLCKPLIESAGGTILLRHEAKEILLKNNHTGKTAIGVRVTDLRDQSSKEFHAPLVFSNAGAHITYRQLLPANLVNAELKKLEKIPLGYGVVNLYLGLKESPKSIGVHGENYWIYNSYDQKELFEKRNDIVHGAPTFAFVSFGATNDPEAKTATAQIISIADYELFEKFKNQEWQNRDSEYQALKQKISDSLIAFADQRIPGLKDLIAYQELATPITFEHFTGHLKGQIYGLSMTPTRANENLYGAKTPIKNLYLTGADVAGSGVTGALFGGVLAYAEVFGYSVFGKIMKG